MQTADMNHTVAEKARAVLFSQYWDLIINGTVHSTFMTRIYSIQGRI